MPRFEVVSHRGGALLWPENSLAACAGTVALGAEQLQVDVHLSRDGHPVVMHDATLDRTAEAEGPLAARDWAELRRIRLRGADGACIPDLAGVIEAIRESPLRLRLELKQDAAGQPYPNLAARIVEVLRGRHMRARTLVSAFAPAGLQAFAAVAPDVPRIWLIDAATAARTPWSALAAQATAAGLRGLGARWNVLDAAGARTIRAAGLSLCCFACNDAPAIEAAIALGADEIMTDRPDLALRRRG